MNPYVLATVHATKETFRFRVEFQNFARGVDVSSCDPKETEKKAMILFKEGRPKYRVGNLRTDLLTERVLLELSHLSNGGVVNFETVRLTNGCCSNKICPTTQFIECVLRATSM